MLSRTTLLAGLSLGAAIDNGKGITPVRVSFLDVFECSLNLFSPQPMGWRSWNLFGADVNQELIQKQVSRNLNLCHETIISSYLDGRDGVSRKDC